MDQIEKPSSPFTNSINWAFTIIGLLVGIFMLFFAKYIIQINLIAYAHLIAMVSSGGACLFFLKNSIQYRVFVWAIFLYTFGFVFAVGFFAKLIL